MKEFLRIELLLNPTILFNANSNAKDNQSRESVLGIVNSHIVFNEATSLKLFGNAHDCSKPKKSLVWFRSISKCGYKTISKSFELFFRSDIAFELSVFSNSHFRNAMT
jgi:hypothetical protein